MISDVHAGMVLEGSQVPLQALPTPPKGLEHNLMTMRENLLFALTGWVAGLCSALAVALVVFPALLGETKSISTWPDLLFFGLIVLLISPFTLAGGLIGGRVL